MLANQVLIIRARWAVQPRPSKHMELIEMTTPRLFLGIFALALILPLLLLASVGSSEPTDGPSSERATAAPTDLPDSERATDEPEGRASFGQTTPAPASPETDREALVALYNATGGPNWIRDNKWLSDVPISEWEDVATDNNGRVTELDLEGNQLSGCVPSSLSGRLDMEYSDARMATPASSSSAGA